MNPEAVALVESSWTQVAPIAAQAADLFYAELFERDPQLRPLFRGNMVEQGAKLMQMIGLAVGKLRQPEVLVPVLQNLGRRHAGYGVADAHYGTVGAALLATLEKGLGPAFTPEVRAAWASIYGVMAEVMTVAARPAQAA
jgi:methyl-accepting chemotaxis protein